jgi:hypothetical protein
VSGKGTIQAGGAPAKVLAYLREHPDSTAVAAVAALQLPRTEVYGALRRLEALELVHQTCQGKRWTQLSRWSPRLEMSMRFELSPLRALSPWGWHATGAPIGSVNTLRMFTIGGPRRR